MVDFRHEIHYDTQIQFTWFIGIYHAALLARVAGPGIQHSTGGRLPRRPDTRDKMAATL